MKEETKKYKDLTSCFITSSILFGIAMILVLSFLQMTDSPSFLCLIQLFWFGGAALTSWVCWFCGAPRKKRGNRDKYFKKQFLITLQGLIVASAIAAFLESIWPQNHSPSWTIFGIPASVANLLFQSVTFLILKIQERLIEKSH